MTEKAHSPIGLLGFRNEILLEIVSLLSTLDLRRLSRVNSRLRFLVGDYLLRYRYNFGLIALPNELILEVLQHLGRQKDRSRFARTSRRVYPLVMDYIIRHNVRYDESSLLNYAAKRNLKEMVRMILHLGGDVNTQRGFRSNAMGKRPTPLVIAAFHGHEKMVKTLLESGASHFVHGMRIPLAVAIFKQHEAVALILSQELHPSDMILEKERGTALQMACRAKLVNLVRYYLERGSQCEGRVNVHSLHNCSIALYVVLQDTSRENFVKRKLHKNVYQIVSILLQYGANPDIPIKIGFSHSVTARAIASRHPDPCVRILLAKPTPAIELRGSNLLIGRPWIVLSEDKTLTFHELQLETLPSEAGHYARLCDFLERPNAETSNFIYEDGTEYRGTNHHEDCILSASDIADLEKGGMQWLKKKSEPIAPPPLSSFPQFGIPKASAQHITKEFWAKIPAEASLGVDSAQTPSIGGMNSISQKVKQLEKPVETDPFPRLGQTGLTSNDTRTDLWARFAKNRASQSARETQRTSPSKEGTGVISVRKPSKKKKWEPLLI